jgi:hypothetical protein
MHMNSGRCLVVFALLAGTTIWADNKPKPESRTGNRIQPGKSVVTMGVSGQLGVRINGEPVTVAPGAVGAGLVGYDSRRARREFPPDKYLFVWAGDELGVVPDFLSVVDFDLNSPTYGQIIATASAPTSGNEAHHMSISSDGNEILCGGLLSLLKGQDDIYYFDISDPTNPSFVSSARAQFSSITDDPVPLPGGGFLVTMMGSEGGDAPGRVIEFDKDRQLVGEWPENPPTDGFNPHGISIRPEVNLMITSDFVLPRWARWTAS